MKAEIETTIRTLALSAGVPEDRVEAGILAMKTTNACALSEGAALNISESANRAGLSRPCLYRALAAGAVRSFIPYPGARPRITEGELARWMASRKGAR